MHEADKIVIINWATFINSIQSKMRVPKHIEINTKISAHFHVVMDGKLTIRCNGTSIDFCINGSSMAIISCGQNDIEEIYEIQSSAGMTYRLITKYGLVIFIAW